MLFEVFKLEFIWRFKLCPWCWHGMTVSLHNSLLSLSVTDLALLLKFFITMKTKCSQWEELFSIADDAESMFVV